mgnify:CR=1 FL=1
MVHAPHIILVTVAEGSNVLVMRRLFGGQLDGVVRMDLLPLRSALGCQFAQAGFGLLLGRLQRGLEAPRSKPMPSGQ